MEEKITLLNRISKQWKAINFYIDNFENYYAGKTVYQNKDSYIQLISQLLSLMNAFSGSLFNFAQPIKQEQFMHNIFRVSLDLLEKYKAQKIIDKNSHPKTQQKLQNLYCKNCLEHIRAANISNTRQKLQKTGNILKEWNEEFENDTIFKSSHVFTSEEDELFFQELNKVLSMKEKILSLNESKMEHFLKSIDQFSKDLQNVSFLSETIKPDDLSQFGNSQWANYMNLEIRTFFKKEFNRKIPKWIEKISSAFIKSFQNYKQKQIKKNQCSYGVQVDKNQNNQNFKEIKIETLERSNAQLEKRVVDMKNFITKKDQQHVDIQEKYSFQLLESTLKSVKLQKQLKKSKNVSIAPKSRRRANRDSQFKDEENKDKSQRHLSEDDSFIELKRKKKSKVVTNFQTINIKRDTNEFRNGVRKSVTVVRNMQTPQTGTRNNRQSVNFNKMKMSNLHTEDKSVKQPHQNTLNTQILKIKLQNQKILQSHQQSQKIHKKSNAISRHESLKEQQKQFQQQKFQQKPSQERSSYVLPKINNKSVLRLSYKKLKNQKISSEFSTNRYFQNTSTNISEERNINSEKLQQLYNILISSGLLSQEISIEKFKETLGKNSEILQSPSICYSPTNRLSIFNSLASIRKSSPIKKLQKNSIPSIYEDKQNNIDSITGVQVNWKQILQQARIKFNEQTQAVKLDTLFPDFDLGLFQSKKQALYFEESLNKNYHKRQGNTINDNQKTVMLKIFYTLNLIKKHNRSAYINLATYIQYPFQAMQNGFNPLNIVSGIGLNNFENYFKKICWLHRKCQKNANNICKHLDLFLTKIQLILGKITCQCTTSS